MKKFLALLLALAMVLSLAACGNNTSDATEAPAETPAVEETEGAQFVEAPKAEGDFTYKDSVSTLASNWNPPHLSDH